LSTGEGAALAIDRLLQNSAFGPEDIERLSAAYEEALHLPTTLVSIASTWSLAALVQGAGPQRIAVAPGP
jgi:hypothetical protein